MSKEQGARSKEQGARIVLSGGVRVSDGSGQGVPPITNHSLKSISNLVSKNCKLLY
jgi:hypothetical protein